MGIFEELESVPFKQYQFNDPLTLRRTFNEIYIAFDQFLGEKHPYLFENIATYENVEEIKKRLFEYVESEFGIKTDDLYIRVYFSGDENFTIPVPLDVKKVEIPRDEYEEIFRGISESPIEVASVEDVSSSVVIRLTKGKEAVINYEKRIPLMYVPIIVHELVHAITMNKIWFAKINLQGVSKFSTSEFLAEAITYMFLKDEIEWITTPTVFMNFEYTLYHRLFVDNEKKFRKTVKELLERDFITNLEVAKLITFESFNVYNMFMRFIVDIILNGSPLKFKPLSALVDDYLLIYLLLNYDVGKFLLVKPSVFIGEEAESRETEKLLLKLKKRFFDPFIEYNPERDEVRPRALVEEVIYGKNSKIILPELRGLMEWTRKHY